MLLSDDADHVGRARHVEARRLLVDDDGHCAVLAPQADNHVEGDVALAHDGEMVAGDIAEGDAGLKSAIPVRSPALIRTTPMMWLPWVMMTWRMPSRCSGRRRNASSRVAACTTTK